MVLDMCCAKAHKLWVFNQHYTLTNIKNTHCKQFGCPITIDISFICVSKYI